MIGLCSGNQRTGPGLIDSPVTGEVEARTERVERFV